MTDPLSGVFGALSDPTRRNLFEQLLERSAGCTATELAANALVSRQAIVKHLQVLSHSGLAVASREGREVRYVATTGEAANATTWLTNQTAAWDRRLAKLENRVLAAHDPDAMK